MSLQRRLTLYFILIVILPLAIAGFVVQRVVVDEISRRAVTSLTPALDATVALYNDRQEALDARVRGTLGLSAFGDVLTRGNVKRTREFLASRLLDTSNVDFFLAYDADGRFLAYEFTPGKFLDGVEIPGAEEVMASRIGRGYLRTKPISVRVQGKGRVGSVVGGFWLDGDLLLGSSQEGVVLSVAADGEIIASTEDLEEVVEVDPRFSGSFTTDIGGESEARARPLDGGVSIIASTPTSPLATLSRGLLTTLLALLALAMLGTSLLAYVLARLITQPIEDLAAGAQEIAEGRFDRRVPVRSSDEVGALAEAFNEMSEKLNTTVTQLSSSRDQLQRATRRVGETLRSTHDMRQMLSSILHTGVDAVSADFGVLWRLTPQRGDLYAAATADTDPGQIGRVHVGEGVVGLVAERATNVMLPSPMGGPLPTGAEPLAPVVLAVPIYSHSRVMGVLAIYRESKEQPFTVEDMQTVQFLAEQGGVAIENVNLHEEARRLSLMDGLTGVWNRRFFQMQFKQVLATATRFERPFSLLMLDLDFFKRVNDSHGHQRGDEILVEFSQRVNEALREVDTFARYGGEEFICLLPETDVSGALTTAEKICETIRDEPFGGRIDDPIALTVSIGVAWYPEHGSDFQSLIRSADRALYKAKESGRDRVEVADGSDEPPGKLKLAT